MESSASQQERDLITKLLGTEGVIIDSKYKDSVLLTEKQAERRKELIKDVEYTFALGLNKGDHYVG